MAFAPGTVFPKREFMSLAEFQNGIDKKKTSWFESVTRARVLYFPASDLLPCASRTRFRAGIDFEFIMTFANHNHKTMRFYRVILSPKCCFNPTG